MITWPFAIIVVMTIIALCFLSWLNHKLKLEEANRVLQVRNADLEDKRFEVWKTMNLGHLATHGPEAKRVVDKAMRASSPLSLVPDNVVPLRGPFAGTGAGTNSARGVSFEVDNGTSVEEVKDLLAKAAELPDDEAKAFLELNGLTDVVFHHD